MYKGIYGTLEKDLINIGVFKDYKINLIDKLEYIKSNKRKNKELDETLLELSVYSQWFWIDVMRPMRLKQYYRLYNIFEVDRNNQVEMYFINSFIYNRMRYLAKTNGYKIELEEYYV